MEVTLLVVLLCLQGYWFKVAAAEENEQAEGGAIAVLNKMATTAEAPEGPVFLLEPSSPRRRLPDDGVVQVIKTKRQTEKKKKKRPNPGAHSPLGSPMQIRQLTSHPEQPSLVGPFHSINLADQKVIERGADARQATVTELQ